MIRKSIYFIIRSKIVMKMAKRLRREWDFQSCWLYQVKDLEVKEYWMICSKTESKIVAFYETASCVLHAYAYFFENTVINMSPNNATTLCIETVAFLRGSRKAWSRVIENLTYFVAPKPFRSHFWIPTHTMALLQEIFGT